MSSRDPHRPLLTRRVFLASSLAVGVAGCAGGGFSPLYGVTSSGADLGSTLASVNVIPIPGRVGQQLRNELLFSMRGGGSDLGADYELRIAIRESVRQIIRERDGDSQGEVYRITSEFQLLNTGDSAVLLKGENVAQAAYRRFDSIFANLRARRDAENRAAKDSARSISTRVAAFLSRTG